MTRDEAEALRNDARHWTVGIIYACRDDPRVIVRNRILFGWTWNFAHRLVLPTLLAFIALAIGPAALLYWIGVRNALMLAGVTAIGVLVLVGIAHHVASGPR